MGKIRILIADDNLLAAQALRDNLREYEDFELTNIARDGYF
jgi:DNA-binding NarL/FixJ family response regulator